MAKKITFRGETKSINEWSRITRIQCGTLRYWLNKGLSLADILGPPYNDEQTNDSPNEQTNDRHIPKWGETLEQDYQEIHRLLKIGIPIEDIIQKIKKEILESVEEKRTLKQWNSILSMPRPILEQCLRNGLTTKDKKDTTENKLVDGKPEKTKKPKRTSKDNIIEYDGFRKTVEEWSSALGVHYAILCERLDEHPLEKAFKIPHKISEHIVEYKGQTKTIKSWALELETTYQALYNRFKDGSWPPIRNKTSEQLVRQRETRLAKELKKKEKQKLKRKLKKLEVKLKSHQRFEYEGQTKTVRQWAIAKGIDYQTLRFRLKKGWGIKKSLEEPVREKNRNNT